MYIQVQISTPSLEVSNLLIDKLLAERIIACAQIIGPITSKYHWNNRIEHSKEYLILLKTTVLLFDKLRHSVSTSHPYDTPEIIYTPIQGDEKYLKWISDETTARD